MYLHAPPTFISIIQTIPEQRGINYLHLDYLLLILLVDIQCVHVIQLENMLHMDLKVEQAILFGVQLIMGKHLQQCQLCQ